MFEPKIKIDRQLYDKLQKCAADAGYSSADEFVRHLLEKAVSVQDRDAMDKDAVTKQLQGLGYIE